MRIRSMAVGLGLVLLLLAPAFADSSPPFSLTISTPRPEIKAGSEARVDLVLTNNSNRDAHFRLTSFLCDYATEVRDSAGNLVPDTKLKSTLDCGHGISIGRVIIIQLKPREGGLKDVVVANMLSDMSQPGEYFVQVTWKAPKEFDSALVKSNTIKITVTP
jgi:hypothetical protein